MENNNGDLISPINGTKLYHKGNGLYASEADGLLYILNKDEQIVPLISPINGSPLHLREDGTLGCESDGLLYILNKDEQIVPLISPINGSPLYPSNDGTFLSEYDDLTYIIDNNGKIVEQQKDYIVSPENIEAKATSFIISEIRDEISSTRDLLFNDRVQQSEREE